MRTHTREEVEQAFTEKDIVIYTSLDGTHFILNPFGGGICATQEVSLSATWELNDDTLKRITIIHI